MGALLGPRARSYTFAERGAGLTAAAPQGQVQPRPCNLWPISWHHSFLWPSLPNTCRAAEVDDAVVVLDASPAAAAKGDNGKQGTLDLFLRKPAPVSLSKPHPEVDPCTQVRIHPLVQLS